MLETVALYLAFGGVAGILSGLFGIGGGVVIVPFLAWQFTRAAFPAESIMIMAIATSLATIVITSISAVYAHQRLGSVHWPMVARLAPGILLGALLGSIIAERLPVAALKLMFALFLLIAAGRMISAGQHGTARAWGPRVSLILMAGGVIGTLSAILGIGGGTLSVPLLSRLRFPMRVAVGTSCACGFPLAIMGSVSYAVLGWRMPSLPPASLGYIYLPAFAGIVAASTLFAPLGARLAHWLPTFYLKKLFALALFAIGARMLWQSLAR